MQTRWRSGAHIVQAAADSYHMDMWDNQSSRVFVIVEKAALSGVLGGVCRKFDIPLLAARGYPSVSIVREMALEYFGDAINNGQDVTVLHLGDHDPSGKDMAQIEEVNPPPNPAKTTDSRFQAYKAEFGEESWEPAYIVDLVTRKVEDFIDPDAWAEKADEVEAIRTKLQRTAARFDTSK